MRAEHHRGDNKHSKVRTDGMDVPREPGGGVGSPQAAPPLPGLRLASVLHTTFRSHSAQMRSEGWEARVAEMQEIVIAALVARKKAA